MDWQGYFYESLVQEKKGRFLHHGHYAIVTEVNAQQDTITLADPYYEFSPNDRTFPIDWFKTRWWDMAEEKDPSTGKEVFYYTSRLMFVVTPNKMTFLEAVGMKKVPADYLQQKLSKGLLSLEHHPLIDEKRKRWMPWRKAESF